MFCSPSLRLNVSVSGENAPAAMFVAPPFNDGPNGRCAPGHGLPAGSLKLAGPLSISNVELESPPPHPVHGSIAAVVVYAPQRAGLANGALSPPKKCSSNVSNGNCGVFLNVETN